MIKYKVLVKHDRIDDGSEEIQSSAGWRPWPLRTPNLINILALCIVSCISVDLIIRGCSTGGCRVFGEPSVTKISSKDYFVYNLLPTIITVVFSLLWTVAHHDFLRLEPYFSMSAQEGAAGKDSILLDYPYQPLIFLPFMAGRRRHYTILLSACIQIVASFVVIPLVSGIFTDADLDVYSNTTALRHTLKQLRNDREVYSTNFTYQVYDYLWLNGTLPPFTTSTYALLPLRPVTSIGDNYTITLQNYTATSQNLTGIGENYTWINENTTWLDLKDIWIGENETWVGETTMYSAELNCALAQVQYLGGDRPAINLTSSMNPRYNCSITVEKSGVGVNVTVPYLDCVDTHELTDIDDIFKSTGTEMKFDATWTSHAEPLGADDYLYIFASSDKNGPKGLLPQNISAIFCSASYHSQIGIGTFTMPAGDVIKFSPAGNSTILTGLDGLQRVLNSNPSYIGYDIYKQSLQSPLAVRILGMRPELVAYDNTQLRLRMDLPKDITIATSGSRAVAPPSSLTSSIFLNQTAETLHEFLDPEKLAGLYKDTFKLFFAVGMGQELVNKTGALTVPVRQITKVRGVTVNGLSARGAQACLGLLACMVALLGVRTFLRACRLEREPNSLATALQLLKASPDMCARLKNAEFYSEKLLRKSLDRDELRYRLVVVDSRGPMIEVLDTSEPKGHKELNVQGKPWRAEQLWMLRMSTGVAVVGFFTLLGGVLVAIYIMSRSYIGLAPGGSPDSFQYKLYYTYIPMIVGMAFEPILVNLGSAYCMLGPYQSPFRYSRKHKDSMVLRKRALVTDFDKSPPHFQLFGALRSGDFVLAALTTTILLANVLTVAISGLFSATVMNVNFDRDLNTSTFPRIVDRMFSMESDMYNSLDRNVTAHIDLPSWTTQDLYVLPFYPTEPPSDPVLSYQGRTKAFGTNINCTLLPLESLSSGWGDEGYLNVSQGFKGTCLSKNTEILTLRDVPRGSYGANGEVYQHEDCPGIVYAYWAQRFNATNVRVIALSCETLEVAYDLTARVSSTQRILATSDQRALPAAEMLSLYPPNDTTNFPPGFITKDFVSSLNLPRTGRRTQYTKLVWLNYFMNSLHPSVYNQTSGTLSYLPNTTEITSAFEDIYRRLFAIKLRLNDYVFSPGDTHNEVGTLVLLLNRVVVNNAMTAVAGGAILYTILVLAAIFLHRRPVPRGHLPTCLVGFYASLYASTAKSDVYSGIDPHKSGTILLETYAYGWFLAGDGEWHYGICRKSEAKVQREGDEKKAGQNDIREADLLGREGRHAQRDGQNGPERLDELEDSRVGNVENVGEGVEGVRTYRVKRKPVNRSPQ